MNFRPRVLPVILLATLTSATHTLASAAGFDNRTLKGSYAATIDGVYTFFNQKPAGIPAWFTGVVEADGKGHITAFTGTFNIGTCLVVSHDGNGTYAVNSNGTATATVELKAQPIGVPNSECPPEVNQMLISMPSSNTVKFSLAVQNSRAVYGSIVGKTDSSGKPVSFGGTLTAFKQ